MQWFKFAIELEFLTLESCALMGLVKPLASAIVRFFDHVRLERRLAPIDAVVENDPLFDIPVNHAFFPFFTLSVLLSFSFSYFYLLINLLF